MLADFEIFAFQNPNFKISADFKISSFQNNELQISADFHISFPKSWIQGFG